MIGLIRVTRPLHKQENMRKLLCSWISGTRVYDPQKWYNKKEKWLWKLVVLSDWLMLTLIFLDQTAVRLFLDFFSRFICFCSGLIVRDLVYSFCFYFGWIWSILIVYVCFVIFDRILSVWVIGSDLVVRSFPILFYCFQTRLLIFGFLVWSDLFFLFFCSRSLIMLLGVARAWSNFVIPSVIRLF